MIDVLEVWHNVQIQRRAEEGPKPTAFGTVFRASDAGSCIRKRVFSAIDTLETEEIAPTSLLAFEIGNAIHESIQEALLRSTDVMLEVETPIDLSTEALSLSGHTDGIITMDDGTKIILEIKTMAGFGARQTFGGSPKREHIAQAGMYALGVEADGILLVYVSKETVFKTPIKPGSVEQWYFGMDDEALPYESVREIAQIELDRFTDANGIFDSGMLPEALVPNDAGELVRVDNPPGYMSKGIKPWNCAYCNYNSICRAVGPDEVSLEIVRRISA